MKTKKLWAVRQGDVWIERINAIPRGAAKVPSKAGLVTLAYGEATGHHHSINSRGVQHWSQGEYQYLKVDRRTEVKHQEHAPIRLPAGQYRVRIQRAYSPQEIRRVVD